MNSTADVDVNVQNIQQPNGWKHEEIFPDHQPAKLSLIPAKEPPWKANFVCVPLYGNRPIYHSRALNSCVIHTLIHPIINYYCFQRDRFPNLDTAEPRRAEGKGKLRGIPIKGLNWHKSNRVPPLDRLVVADYYDGVRKAAAERRDR